MKNFHIKTKIIIDLSEYEIKLENDLIDKIIEDLIIIQYSMIIKAFELEKKSFKSKIFLFYGSNKGLIDETLNKTIKPLFQHISIR